MLDPKFTQEIISAWQGMQFRILEDRSPPPPEAIQRFIDVVFLASLKKEEGQSVKFSVAMALEEDLNKSRGTTTLPPVEFTSQLPFSPASLVKMAGAFDPELTTILVQWKPQSQSFEYWGLEFHAPDPNKDPFAVMSVSVEGSANFRPRFFTAIVKGPAIVAIASGDSLIGTLQSGQFSISKPSVFRRVALGRYIDEAIKQNPSYAEHGDDYLVFVFKAMELLLSEAAKRGHGGTIVFMPSSPTQAAENYKSKYEFQGTYGLHQTLNRYIRNKSSVENGIAFGRFAGYGKVISETVKRIAQLASVDGALILTFDFEVLAFGSTLTAQRSKHKAVIGPDGSSQASNTSFEIEGYGTRHRSAFDFVSAQPGAIAFVISEDGPVRAFRCENDTTTYVWPDCTVSKYV